MRKLAITSFLVVATTGAAQSWSPFQPSPAGVTGTLSAASVGLLSVTLQTSPSGGQAFVFFEWDGLNWVQRFPAAVPPARDGFALAYDSTRQRVVLFGGRTQSTTPTWYADTWEWDGSNWVPKVSPVFPTARSGARMAFDSARGRVVMFGGIDAASAFLSDVWEWNGINWTQVSTNPSPPGRIDHALAYDPIRQRTVLFGGWAWTMFADTWQWDGTSWSLQSASGAPTARARHAMCFDPYNGGLLLFGGHSCPSGNCASNPITYHDDAYLWNGTT